jgi:C7-C12 aromatase (ARO/CYC)
VPEKPTHVTSASCAVNAPADAVFAVLAEVEKWPQFFPSMAHTEYLERTDTSDRVEYWAVTPEETVRHWIAARELDRDAGRITFTQEGAVGPFARLGGVWQVTATGPGTSLVESTHQYTLTDDDPAVAERAKADLERNSGRQFAVIKDTAERREELTGLVISFTDDLYIAGAIEDCYAILYEADKWPSRFPHVTSLEMTEDTPNFQFFDMGTKSADGSTHQTRSVRICLPYRKIVYKQMKTPPLLAAHTGHWGFTETPEGVIAQTRHTATIKPDMLHVLGEGTTLADARRYLRKVLSANSMANLQYTKDYAERRAD